MVALTILLALARLSYDSFCRYLTARRYAILPGVLQFSVMGLVPLAVISINRPSTIAWQIAETALFTFIVWMSFFSAHITTDGGATAFKPLLKVLRPLVGYGIQRVPTIFGMIVILSAPVVVAKWLGMDASSVIAVGGAMALLRMFTITNNLMTQVMLPRLSWAQSHAPQLLPGTIGILLGLAFAVAFCVCMGLVAAGDSVLGIWLHRPPQEFRGVTLPFWLGAFPLVLVFFLRPTNDALNFKAYNTLNVFLSILTMACVVVLGHWVFGWTNTIGLSVLVGCLVLALLSIRTTVILVGGLRQLEFTRLSWQLRLAFLGTPIILFVSILVRSWELSVSDSFSSVLPLLTIGASLLIYMAYILLILRRSLAELTRPESCLDTSGCTGNKGR